MMMYMDKVDLQVFTPPPLFCLPCFFSSRSVVFIGCSVTPRNGHCDFYRNTGEHGS